MSFVPHAHPLPGQTSKKCARAAEGKTALFFAQDKELVGLIAVADVIKQTSPRGETMYWIGPAGAAMDDAEGTDFHATAQGFMSMTPLKVDLTDHDSLSYWALTASRLSEGDALTVAPDHAA